MTSVIRERCPLCQDAVRARTPDRELPIDCPHCGGALILSADGIRPAGSTEPTGGRRNAAVLIASLVAIVVLSVGLLWHRLGAEEADTVVPEAIAAAKVDAVELGPINRKPNKPPEVLGPQIAEELRDDSGRPVAEEAAAESSDEATTSDEPIVVHLAPDTAEPEPRTWLPHETVPLRADVAHLPRDRTHERLETRLRTVAVDDVPLRRFVGDLIDVLGYRPRLPASLPDTPIRLRREDAAVGDLLRSVLQPAGFRVEVREDGDIAVVPID